jgi:VCBS repeat-containing protein
MKTTVLFLVAGIAAFAAGVKLGSLSAPVQATIRDQTKNATLVGISKETESGKTVYEVESKVNGKARDFMVDAAGKVTSVEEETDINSIPAAARTAIQKAAAGGSVKRVETVTEGGGTAYEAAIQVKGKNSEVTVNADGSRRK